MADVSDVETVLRDTVVSIVYPNGTGQPSIVNRDIRVFRGYPIPKNLDADLAAGKINISVDAISGMCKQIPQFMRQFQPLPIPTPSLIATVSNTDTITLSGTINLPQSVMTIANDVGYPYVVQAGDTLDTIAVGIAAIVPNASAVGPVVTINNCYRLIVRIGVLGTVVKEIKRQEQVFGITVWTTTDNDGYLIRDSLCSTLDAKLSELIWLTMPDGFYANISCQTGLTSDNMQKQKLLWRSLHYTVQYATTISEQDYTVTDAKYTLTTTYN